MKIDILKVDKETMVLSACGQEMTVTTDVIYSASILLDECLIKGSFKFKEEEILSEKDASAKIMKLFVGGRQWALN